jgi:hypothetical protein
MQRIEDHGLLGPPLGPASRGDQPLSAPDVRQTRLRDRDHAVRAQDTTAPVRDLRRPARCCDQRARRTQANPM